tara:strand:+ start:533 stop:1183 length:651 start_codon:yes stop_codon:yes gene_type:complete
MEKVYFQIGTNDGNDTFKIKCLNDKPTQIILVEPNPLHKKSITDNYKDFSNVHIFINAIYYNDNEDVELVVPAINGIFGNIGENGIKYNHSHLSLIPMNNWGSKDNMFKISAKSITFDTICKNLNINNIDYLQIDTEGVDSEIIKMIDFNKINIQQIRFEKWQFDSSYFTKYFGNDTEFGNKGMLIVKEKLKKNNYMIESIKDAAGNDYIATKIVN